MIFYFWLFLTWVQFHLIQFYARGKTIDLLLRYTCNNLKQYNSFFVYFGNIHYFYWGGVITKSGYKNKLLRQIYQTQSMYKSNKNFSGISKKIFNVLKKGFYLFFSRPEPKAQVGFSDSILYVVRHPVRL